MRAADNVEADEKTLWKQKPAERMRRKTKTQRVLRPSLGAHVQLLLTAFYSERQQVAGAGSDKQAQKSATFHE